MTITTRRILIIAFAAALAGCAREAAPPSPAPPPAPVPPPSATIGTDEFFKLSASRSLMVVKASEQAATRSADTRTLALARRLAEDHRGIAAQLSLAGRRLNMVPPATPLPLDEVLLDRLQASAAFDADYVALMQRAVAVCAAQNRDYADKGDSPTLRPVARFAAATCDEELRLF